MSKAALREQRRSQRIARRNRQRMIIGIIAFLVVVLILYFVYRDYTNRVQATTTPTAVASTPGGPYAIGTLDATPPAPSANAVTTTSGLVYEDLRVGDGVTAKTGDSVSVNYTGWLTDGTKFDSSIDRGQTSDFTLAAGNVITGWVQGVVGMRVNGTRLLVIPPALAYGASGSGKTIPPNATLIFEVQLVAIK